MILLFMSQRCQWYHCKYKNGVNDTAVQPTLSNIFANDPKNCFICGNLIWLHMAQWYHRHRSDLHTVQVTAVSAVSITPLLLAQRCQWHRCDFGPHIWEAVGVWLPLEVISIKKKNMHRQIVLHFKYIYNFHTKNMGVNEGLFFCHSGVIATGIVSSLVLAAG
jgi:hypothetical protein